MTIDAFVNHQNNKLFLNVIDKYSAWGKDKRYLGTTFTMDDKQYPHRISHGLTYLEARQELEAVGCKMGFDYDGNK